MQSILENISNYEELDDKILEDEMDLDFVEEDYITLKYNKDKKYYWYYEELKHLNNEQIVKKIQETDDPLYWYELDMRTKKLYSSVMREKVHSYYKENMREDVLSILKIGWVKAVKTYNEEKATAEFIPYCSFIMDQNYRMFARRINKDKIGNSVRDEILSCVAVDGYTDNDKMSQGCIDIIMKYDCEEYTNIESEDYVKDILERLRLHDETQYIIIKKHCVEGMTQKDLGIMLNMSQSAISRHIKKGMKFLKKELEFEEVMINVL